MDMKEAFALIAGICVNHNTTLEGHQKIQNALKVVREVLFVEHVEEENKNEGSKEPN